MEGGQVIIFPIILLYITRVTAQSTPDTENYPIIFIPGKRAAGGMIFPELLMF